MLKKELTEKIQDLLNQHADRKKKIGYYGNNIHKDWGGLYDDIYVECFEDHFRIRLTTTLILTIKEIQSAGWFILKTVNEQLNPYIGLDALYVWQSNKNLNVQINGEYADIPNLNNRSN